MTQPEFEIGTGVVLKKRYLDFPAGTYATITNNSLGQRLRGSIWSYEALGSLCEVEVKKGGRYKRFTVYPYDLELVSDMQYFKDRLIAVEKEAEELNSIIHWMEDSNAKVYNEEEHRVWKAITIFENTNATKIQKSKAIAKLIKEHKK